MTILSSRIQRYKAFGLILAVLIMSCRDQSASAGGTATATSTSNSPEQSLGEHLEHFIQNLMTQKPPEIDQTELRQNP